MKYGVDMMYYGLWLTSHWRSICIFRRSWLMDLHVSVHSKHILYCVSICTEDWQETMTSVWFHLMLALEECISWFIAKVKCLQCLETSGSNLQEDLRLFVLFILFYFPLRHNIRSPHTSPPHHMASATQHISEALVLGRLMASCREYKAIMI